MNYYFIKGKKFHRTLYDNGRNIHSDLKKGTFIISIDNSKFKKGGKNFTSFNTSNEIVRYINKFPKSQRNFYEYRKRNAPFKFFFDIDFDLIDKKTNTPIEPPPELLKNVIQEIKFGFEMFFFGKELTDDQIYIYHSPTSSKISYHIILPYYYTSNLEVMKAYRDFVYENLASSYKYKYTINEPYIFPQSIVDKKVYGTSGHFRLLHCCKEGKNNFKKPYSTQENIDSLSVSLITKILPGSTEFNTYNKELINENNSMFENEIIGACEKFKDTLEVGENIIKFVLDNLSTSRSDEYDDWIKVGFALFNSGFGEEWFDYFSQKSDKYDEESVHNFWNGLNSNGNSDKKLKYGSLLYFLKKDNPKSFFFS